MIVSFSSQLEYQSFRAWVLTGHCIQQRMASGTEGGSFTIPDHWYEKARLSVDWPLIMPIIFSP